MGRQPAVGPLRAEDVDDVLPLLRESPLLRRYGTDIGALSEVLRAGIRRGDIVLARRRAGAVHGLAWLMFTDALDSTAYLRLLLVAERQQGSGIGAELLREAERIAADRSNHLLLLTTADNAGARRFYERAGYALVGPLPGYVQPALDEVLYHKPLRRTEETA